MAFEVYDFRDVNKNVLVTPHIRARLYQMEPGQVDRRHSHDLGHEVFLILEGRAEFMIAGHVEVLEAGQMCIARADEIHQVRNLLPDRRTVMFLSVTPHIQPTHTGRDADGCAHPPAFRANSFYDDVDDTGPIAELLDAFVSGADALADEAPGRPPTGRRNRPKRGARPPRARSGMQPWPRAMPCGMRSTVCTASSSAWTLSGTNWRRGRTKRQWLVASGL